jgi:glycerol-3-phosphate dehydrogenase
MRKLETEVLVIGGGATGTGVLRDLSMRGFRALLVEKRDLAHGTTGRYHGLLHSGGRYAVRDSHTAAECYQENQVLRRIMPQAIEDTGGYFVVTPGDDVTYGDTFMAACAGAGIPVEEISISRMLQEEPSLNPGMQRCFRVPDGAADSFLAAALNVESARAYGGDALTYHQVEELVLTEGQVTGAVLWDLARDERVQVQADVVVNAAGAWAGQITAMAGVDVPVLCGKGTMVALNYRPLGRVVNRCRPAADGDIIVPTHTVAVVGTTDVKVADPDRYPVEAWEIHAMLEEGEKLVPGLQQMRVVRVWAGVRPLYHPSAAETASDREVSRSHYLLDHSQRDGVEGLVTIVGGKWTTYRLMAEQTVDLVCQKLGSPRPCRTAEEALPASSGHSAYHHRGTPLAAVETEKAYGQLVCECELATRGEVEASLLRADVKAIDDVRRDVRLGMGPCQGAFCSYRVGGLWHRLRQPEAAASNVALRDFLQERWKGVLPAMAGEQVRQARLTEMIYADVMNMPQAPGEADSRLGATLYQGAVAGGDA